MYCKRANKKYYLKDRMGFLFRVVPDNLQTVTTIYNSKILSVDFEDLNVDYARIDILEENISEINEIICNVRKSRKFSGQDYTNGNMGRDV